MFSAAFWLEATERAIRTAAQALLGALTAGFAFTDAAQWGDALIAAGIAALISYLMSVVATRVGDPESPSFVDGGERRSW